MTVFVFSSRLASNSGPLGGVSMTSAEELFSNGQIWRTRKKTTTEKTKPDGGVIKRGRDLKLRSRSVHRKARSLSPLRNAAYQWNQEEEEVAKEREVTGEREVKSRFKKQLTLPWNPRSISGSNRRRRKLRSPENQQTVSVFSPHERTCEDTPF
ncbi:unnamed protein product [Arabidopsis lyrata]|uniref:Predicted protein n=1 Tax=Arabidopsis lyrata subsp. lyrata TaxID=81972 RepID=D7M4S8_ARALL|nr:predicted protein [Arabidopsis lyrata subsp. lyrata]CAH8272328.1 unnamed protein product [Arabidopsis lyrata]